MEVIVVVLLISILSSVMVAVVAVILRNAPATEAQAGNSYSYQGLVTWLPRDVASTPPTDPLATAPLTPPNGFDFVGATEICDGATAGLSLLQMGWTPDDGQNVTYAADYRLVATGSGAKRIERHSCWGTSAPYSNTGVVKVTKDLIDATADEILDGNGDVIGVTMTLATCGADCSSSGPTIVFDAHSHNPGPTNTLPPP